MFKAIFYYFIYNFKNSAYFYFTIFLFLILIYYQSFGIDITISNNDYSFTKLWGVDGQGISEYIGHLAIHFFILVIFTLMYLINLTSTYFSNDYMIQFLINSHNRKVILLKYLLSLIFMIYIIVFVNVVILNIILFVTTGSTFFVPSFFILIYIVPVIYFIGNVIVLSSLLLDNKIYKVSVAYFYLIIMPFILITLNRNNVELPIIPNWILDNSEFISPFFITYFGGILKYSFYIDNFPEIKGILLMGTVFYFVSLYKFEKKVY